MLRINGEEKDFAGELLLDVLLKEGYEPTRVVVERNLEIVPKDQLQYVVLQDKDVIEVIRFVVGGYNK